MTTVPLLASLRLQVHNTGAACEWEGVRAELEADAFLRRFGQVALTEGRWQLHLAATYTDGEATECSIEVEPFHFVSFRELLAAGFALRAYASPYAQRLNGLQAAERLLGRAVYPGSGPHGTFWIPPATVHVAVSIQPASARVPFARIEATANDFKRTFTGDQTESEANRAIGQWLAAQPTLPEFTKHSVAVQVTLGDGRSLRAHLELMRTKVQVELRWELIRHFVARSQSPALTASQRRILKMLAQYLETGTSFLALERIEKPRPFRCACAQTVPTRFATLANERILVQALHLAGPDVCRHAADAYADLDPVPTSTAKIQPGPPLARQTWWQTELKNQGLMQT